MSRPKVSVLCLTYNQERYLKQCLDSILSQKTSFDFEVLINDDASTDGTKQIIEDYVVRYSDIVKPVFHDKNQYSQGKRNFIARYLLPRAKGKYIAICEGDDYWLSTDKLQKQVEFMEKYQDYSICFHKVKIEYEDMSMPDQIYPDVEDMSWYTTEELLRLNYIQTNSVMYRKADSYADIPLDSTPADWFLHLYHARLGKIKLIDETMSVYRKHPGGIWWNYDKGRESLWRTHGVGHLAMWLNLRKIYANKPRYVAIIQGHIDEMIETIIDGDLKFDDKNFISAIDKYGRDVLGQYSTTIKRLKKVQSENENLTAQRSSIVVENEIISSKLAAAENELKRIKSTRYWRLRKQVAKIVGPIRAKLNRISRL